MGTAGSTLCTGLARELNEGEMRVWHTDRMARAGPPHKRTVGGVEGGKRPRQEVHSSVSAA